MDTISNFLSSLKNASMAKKAFIEVFYSNQIKEIAEVLKQKGFLTEIKVYKPEKKSYKMIRVDLTYDKEMPTITDVKRLSKPGRRVFVGYDEIKLVAAGYGVLIVSTSRGIMDGREARKKKLGGELICEVR